MLILIGADGCNLQSQVARRFGHAAFLITYDTETKIVTTYENNDMEHDHSNLLAFLEKGVEAFIVGNIGPHAFEIVNTPMSKVYLARKMSVREAVDKLSKEELKQLSEPTAKRSIGHIHQEINIKE